MTASRVLTSTGCLTIITGRPFFQRSTPTTKRVVINKLFRPSTGCAQTLGHGFPPRPKIKVGTDPDVPRMRDTDDALDGNLAGPFICLHNHLLIVAYNTHSQTRYQNLADFSASMLICFHGFTCSKDFKLKEVQNVFSQTPIQPLRLCYYASIHDEYPW